jgi:amidase
VPFNGVWNHVGNPAAAVPAGFDADGLPLSVQLVAPPDAEQTLFSLAHEIETARPWAGSRPPVS